MQELDIPDIQKKNIESKFKHRHEENTAIIT